MNFINALFAMVVALITLSAEAQSQANRHLDPDATAPFTLVPVSNMKLTMESGCGAPPPNGQTCTNPTILNMDFVVSHGGSCHAYKAIVRNYRDHQSTLIITDTEMQNCTRPEIMNYNVKMSLEVKTVLDSIHLVNPVSIQNFPRP